MRILLSVPDGSTARWIEAARRGIADAEVVEWKPGDGPTMADYAMVWTPPAAFFSTNSRFKAVFNLGAGVDAILRLPDLTALLKGAPLIRLNDAGMAPQMAEYVCSHVASHVRGFGDYEAFQRTATWKRRAAIELSEWPVGVMGVGSIGSVIAGALRGFGYPVRGWSRTPKILDGIPVYAGRGALDEFLASSRILVLVLPRTGETESIIDARALETMRPGGMLVNVGRGALIDDDALIAALDRGQLERAVLDVFREEPLPPSHPFWAHLKITVTPHVSGYTLVDPAIAQIAEKIACLERGEEVDGVVDIERGY
jgi:glyoxylate/hydroxypyruvate reductase